MKIETQAQSYGVHPSYGVPHFDPDYNGLADAVATCCGEIDTQSAEIERLTARCDGLGEQIERKDAEVARLREALIGLLTRVADDEEYGPDHAVTIARAALSHSQADPTGVSA